MPLPLIPESHLSAAADGSHRLRFMEACAASLLASTQNQAMPALRFPDDAVLGRPLNRVDDFAAAAKRGYVPTVLSERELRALLSKLRPLPRLCAELMYGSGLWVSECVAVRVKDVDLDRLEIVVRAGEGDKDRRAPLGERCAEELRKYLARERHRFDADRRRDIRTTGLGEALSRKYPNAEREWARDEPSTLDTARLGRDHARRVRRLGDDAGLSGGTPTRRCAGANRCARLRTPVRLGAAVRRACCSDVS